MTGGKKITIAVRVDPDVRDALIALAKERRWTLSQTAAVMIEAGLKAEKDAPPRQ
jgi:hypothetical protein